jgi:hypothetical protein
MLAKARRLIAQSSNLNIYWIEADAAPRARPLPFDEKV